jgi:hypothetical protein
MAIKLTCPGCWGAVEAEDADRGKTIQCGICGSDMSVPPAPAAKAAPTPTAKPLPTAPVAPSGPKRATPVTAARPVAPPRKAAPAAPGRKRRDEEPEGGTRRFKERDRDGYDDEDDDDDHPRRADKKGGGGVLIAVIGIGAVLAVGALGAVAALVMNGQPTAATTAPTQSNNAGDINSGAINPNPIGGNQPRPGGLRADGWVEFRGGTNFRCDMPVAVQSSPTKYEYATHTVSGTTFTSAEGNGAIRVTVKELARPANVSGTNEGFVAWAFGLPLGLLVREPAPRPVGKHRGVEYTGRTADGYENTFLAVAVGRSGFVFRYQWRADAPGGAQKRDDFLASVTVSLPPEPVMLDDPLAKESKEPKAITKAWRAVETKHGFSVALPDGVVKDERSEIDLGGQLGHASGRHVTIDDGEATYHVFYHDLSPDQAKVETKWVAQAAVRSQRLDDLQGEEAATVDGKPAVRWVVRRLGQASLAAGVRMGDRVFTFACARSPALEFRYNLPTVLDRQERFFNAIRITYDPKTHPPYAAEPEWVPMATTVGFTAPIPRQSSVVNDYNPFGFTSNGPKGKEWDAPKGKEWKADIDGITYQVFVVEFAVPPGVKRNLLVDKKPADLVKGFIDGRMPEGPDTKAKLGTVTADGYVLKNISQEVNSHLRVVRVGTLVYVAKTTRTGDCGDKEYADKSAKFFASFRFGEGGVALPPAEAGVAGGLGGEFERPLGVIVESFWAGAFLPEKKEFVTFKAGGGFSGVVTRYSYPDFKRLAIYMLAKPVHRAVVDEKNGKLYVATVRSNDTAISQQDAAMLIGDIQVYDLGKLTDGSLADKEQVKPVSTLIPASATFAVSGLEITADGSALYVSGVVIGGTKAKPTYRGKLLKWDTTAGKLAAEIATDSALRALSVSADGKTVVAVEQLVGPTGGGNLIVFDGPGWKRTNSIPLSGTPSDVTVRGEKVLSVTTTAPGSARLVFGAEGTPTELDAGGSAHYARFTPGGTKLLVSAGMRSEDGLTMNVGLTLYDVAPGKPVKLTRAAFDRNLCGLFVISPDGKLAVMNSGAVLDLEKSKAK